MLLVSLPIAGVPLLLMSLLLQAFLMLLLLPTFLLLKVLSSEMDLVEIWLIR
jgi:hypothetical protein